MPYRLAALIVALIVIVAAIFFFARKGGAGAGGMATSTTGSTSTAVTIPTPNNPVVKGSGYTVELLDDKNLPLAPNYKTSIVYSKDIAPEVRTQLDKNLATLVGRIDKDKYDLRSWIDLGTLHKMGGDYKAAATIWTYVTKLAPKNGIAFNNLADLYQNFLKEYPKAEANWLVAIKIDSSDTNPYRALFDLYNDLEKKPAAAEAILKQGIKANPNAVDLYVILARFYKAAGRAADAQAEYKQAIQVAQTAGQAAMTKEIQTEAGL